MGRAIRGLSRATRVQSLSMSTFTVWARSAQNLTLLIARLLTHVTRLRTQITRPVTVLSCRRQARKGHENNPYPRARASAKSGRAGGNGQASFAGVKCDAPKLKPQEPRTGQKPSHPAVSQRDRAQCCGIPNPDQRQGDEEPTIS